LSLFALIHPLFGLPGLHLIYQLIYQLLYLLIHPNTLPALSDHPA
jgi:hypothetical protein